MAIPLGQPVAEISHGLEGIKIDSHVRITEEAGKFEVQNGTDLSSPIVATVQAQQVGHEHSGGEVAVRTCSSEAAILEKGHLGPPSGLAQIYAPNSALEHTHPGVEHIAYAIEQFPNHPEQFSQHPYVGLSQVPIQGPIYTGYPAPIANYPGYYPYPMDGVTYNNQVVNYTPVYSQNYYCSPQGAAPYNVGYTGLYGYPQYPVAPVDHYNVTAMSPPLNEEGMMVAELQVQDPGAFMPGGYQPLNPNIGHGQWVPMAMAGPPPAGESMPNFNVNMVSYPADFCASGPLNLALNQQPSLWVPLPEGPKGPNVGDESKFELEQCSKECDSGHDSMSKQYKVFLERMDAKIPVVDNKKFVKKKQLSLMYRSMVPSWARSGHVACMNAAYPSKAHNAKSKGSATRLPNAEPLVEPEVNLASFTIDFEDAKHFIIKSFSEENVFRSIQYGVWASTPNGNKKLDEAYRDAKARAVGKAKGCPVFLYFSVNGSGKFCGVAEMVGPVDYNNSMDFWERNRWCGSFPVKWQFIKDVPHSQLRRIILQNNENKPVTSSRDTQEVNFEQGLQMLGIIKNYSTKASILDNFLTPQRGVSEARNTVEQPPAESKDEANHPGSKDEANHEGNGEANSGSQEKEACEVQQECNTAVLESTALRDSNGDGKARESHGKPKLENPNGDAMGDIGGREADKENVMVPHVCAPAGAL